MKVTVGSGFTPRNYRRRRQPILSELKVWVSEGCREAAPHRRKRRIVPLERVLRREIRPPRAVPTRDGKQKRRTDGRFIPSPFSVANATDGNLGGPKIRTR